LRRRFPAFAWAWFAYLVILAPVSGLAQSGTQLVAERYSHLACVPFALLAGAGLAAVALRSRFLAWGALTLVAAACAWRTHDYERAWHDSRSLWAHALAHDPEHDTAFGNLAALELETAQTLKDPSRAWDTMLLANQYAERSVELRPDLPRYLNLAATLIGLGDLRAEGATERFERAAWVAVQAREIARTRSIHFETRWYLVLVVALDRVNHWDDVVTAGEEALREWPSGPHAPTNEELNLRRMTAKGFSYAGRTSEAVALMEATAKLAPQEVLVWLDLSRAADKAGDAARAREAAREGLALADEKFGPNAARKPWYAELVERAR
ncbi:MAG: hypothetical protein HZA53_08825, partial [Planctomycetes bacterium]|nr:hypothetical protein [Planctomycetota bacterium]